jgi:allantoin racemase
VRHAELLVALRPRAPRNGSFAPPPVKPNAGLPDAIAKLLRERGAAAG